MINAEDEYKLSLAEIAFCESALQKLAETKGVISCIIASPDGFAVAKAGQDTSQINRLAAMSSSATAVANALVNELQFDALNAQIIDAKAGKIIVMSLPTKKQELALLCTCTPDALIGQVLYGAKNAAKEVIYFFNQQR